MCGRFSQNYTWAELHALMHLLDPTPRNLRARYNIAPTTQVDVVRLIDDKRDLASMKWGLIPIWWKKPLKELPATFNARIETVTEKPMFRSAFKSRRCIVPASGFFEWTGPKIDRQPHYFSAADGSPILAFAGLWENWQNPETGDNVPSCTILVTSATTWMNRYHDRMPVILGPLQMAAWLDGSLSLDALQPASEDALQEWNVSRAVNKAGVGDDDPATIAAVS